MAFFINSAYGLFDTVAAASRYIFSFPGECLNRVARLIFSTHPQIAAANPILHRVEVLEESRMAALLRSVSERVKATRPDGITRLRSEIHSFIRDKNIPQDQQEVVIDRMLPLIQGLESKYHRDVVLSTFRDVIPPEQWGDVIQRALP